jgi:hypothetical protein
MIKLGEAVEYMFQLSRFSSGAVYAATGTPVGTIYKNGVADALTVTCTIVNGAGEIGLWKAVFTPTSGAGFAAADHVALRITATVDGVASGGIVWQDRIDSADLTDVNAKTTNLPASPAAVGSAMTISVGTGVGQINLASGKVPATIAAGDLATDSITADALKADAATEIAAAVAANASFLKLLSFCAGKVVISGTSVAFYAADNTTVTHTFTIGETGRTVA